jgi:hypothetical protein
VASSASSDEETSASDVEDAKACTEGSVLKGAGN